MQVILLERVEALGSIGDEVDVKNGFARNFLIPQGKALRANEANRKRFEAERAEIEARNERNRAAAAETGKTIEGAIFVLIRQAGDTGQLFGSVTARDISDAAREAGHSVARNAVLLNQPIKTIGMHDVSIRLHAEVTVTVQANVARSADEAERQAAGEDIVETLASEEREASDEQASSMAEAASEAAAERGPSDDDDD